VREKGVAKQEATGFGQSADVGGGSAIHAKVFHASSRVPSPNPLVRHTGRSGVFKKGLSKKTAFSFLDSLKWEDMPQKGMIVRLKFHKYP
jgi:hypothetical protein